jgi:AraC-like DNA-binding protein
MTFYQREIGRIRDVCYSNEKQLNAIIEARFFIVNNFDQELNLDVLAHICFISKFHFLRIFKRYYGQTPKQYLTDIRIEKSKEYLKKGLTISQASFAVGFESPCSFSTLFKSRTGLTPTDFQKRATFTMSV